MRKVGRVISSVYIKTITALSILFVTFILVLSVVSTCEITRGGDIYFLSDNIWINIVILVLFGGIIYILRRILSKGKRLSMIWHEMEIDNERFVKYKNRCLLIILGIGIVWVCAARTGLRSDDRMIQETVGRLMFQDYSDIQPGGYIYRYPIQLGYMSYSYLISWLFGPQNHIVYQILNVLYLVLFYKEMSKILEQLKVKKVCILTYLLAGIFFFPAIMFCSYIYGVIPGLFFSVLAVRYEYQFLFDMKYKDALISALAIFIAYEFKSNYLIFGIGMLLFALTFLVLNRKKRIAIYVAVLISVLGMTFAIPRALGFGGQSNLLYVETGLLESSFGPGWFSLETNDAYLTAMDNKEEQNAIASRVINERVGFFLDNPYEMVKFFSRKNASQWNCPTFQSFFVNTYSYSERSEFMHKIISADVEYLVLRIADVFHMLCLVGILLFMVLYFDYSNFVEYLLLPMIFVGGFIFHFVCEAKALYAFPYYMVMIPFSILGYCKCISTENFASIKVKKFSIFSLVISMGIMAIIYSCTGVDYITGDDELYKQDLSYNSCRHILPNGKYCFISDANEESCIELLLVNRLDGVYIRSREGYLSHSNSDSATSYCIDKRDDGSQYWYLQEGPNESIQIYAIEDGQYLYLSYDNLGQLYVGEYADVDSERFYIVTDKNARYSPYS